ncbi:DEAD/DEAH box helicase [Candidatus Deianiraea vastatrix]|uniref:ATP-dependent RNA helicase RhlE n=1 Tax=Candidatus Deianiraea vastatrix TaxID=2163644 RepID=A0A5B8XDS4_9RICK|nr:DEAD/DEAH box helicase [Candidatus Deianiraea vastatrix]QED23468.1 ATP-dependent RNA helicase RhlE [Candidatus Deianiraea vastatrix]
MTLNFENLNLPSALIAKLNSIGFTAPTEIQAKAIPLILDGCDILASSKTGSGKTGAFSMPMLAKVLNGDASALILCPTRELAIQIKDSINNIKYDNTINPVLIFGGSDIKRQIIALKKKPNIIIATPGRLNDHIQRRTIDLSKFNMLILDEFDRMLDMGFKDEIRYIVEHLPKPRQTLMFSATTRQSIKNAAKEYLTNHSEIILANTKEDHKNIKQEFIEVARKDKYEKLVEILEKHFESVIIFVGTKRMADDLTDMLKNDGYKAQEIHGDLRQRERERAIREFRSEKHQILVATDVVARGLDVPHVTLIINYDMPGNPEDYTHRIGRTGRADAIGVSLSFITPSDKKIHRAILEKTNSDEFEGVQRRGGSGSRGGSSRQGAPRRRFNDDEGRNSRAPRRFSGERSGRFEDSRRPSRNFNEDRGSRETYSGNQDRSENSDRPRQRFGRNFSNKSRESGFSPRKRFN